ncbi:putative ABC transport system permease protein [Clostridiales Family XIII bacterium PM5-7]
MLKLERVSKFYSSHGMVSAGFSKVDLEFQVGEFVAITGESGSGKSTLLNVISGLDSYEEGEMFILGEPTSGFSKEDLEDYRKKYIGNIFQTFNLINSYTVYQNVELVLLMSGYGKEEIKPQVKEIIEKVGLGQYENTKASKLSGGQKQRVAIARALAKETPIIVADEPTGNLDSQSAAEIIQLLHELSKDKLIIIVTHNYDQVEQYVTRKITMYDGRVAEDKHLAEKNLSAGEGEIEPKPGKSDGLSFGNMLRLGVRNTFNIKAKCFLLLAVFVFMCAGVIGQYVSFMNLGALAEEQGYNYYFQETGKDRILLTKAGGKVFTDEDYEKLKSMDNIKKIVANDLILDLSTHMNDVAKNENYDYYINTRIASASDFEDRLVSGRMPKTKKEAILVFEEGESYVSYIIEELSGKKMVLNNSLTGSRLLKQNVTIVGYAYTNKAESEALITGQYAEAYVGLNEDCLDDVRLSALENACSQELEIGDAIIEGRSGSGVIPIIPSSKVDQGSVYVSEDIAARAGGYATGKELKITNKSLYFEDQFNFTVAGTYTKGNLYYYLERDDFDEIEGSIFVNPKDYAKLFQKGNFQSSVMVKDVKIIDQTIKELEAAGYKTFRVHDGLVDEAEALRIVMNTLRTGILLFVLIVLFFISYFIIKLIFKSRNSYFSISRMLGATRENCRALLRTELFVIFNLAFALCIIVAVVVNAGLIPSPYLIELFSLLKLTDYVILYVLLCMMAILLASRYAKQLFKQTAMNAHKEEV